MASTLVRRGCAFRGTLHARTRVVCWRMCADGMGIVGNCAVGRGFVFRNIAATNIVHRCRVAHGHVDDRAVRIVASGTCVRFVMAHVSRDLDAHNAARCRTVHRGCAARWQRDHGCLDAGNWHRCGLRKRRRTCIKPRHASCRRWACVVGDSFALKLAAFGWTIAALAMTWAIVERRGRKQAERERINRDRESDAAQHERINRLRMATTAMKDALDSIDREQNDER